MKTINFGTWLVFVYWRISGSETSPYLRGIPRSTAGLREGLTESCRNPILDVFSATDIDMDHIHFALRVWWTWRLAGLSTRSLLEGIPPGIGQAQFIPHHIVSHDRTSVAVCLGTSACDPVCLEF